MKLVRIQTVKGSDEDHVAEDQRPQAVVDPEAVDHRVEGAEDRDLREDRHREHQVQRQRATAEAEAPERVAGERSERERDQRDRAGDDASSSAARAGSRRSTAPTGSCRESGGAGCTAPA